MNVKDLLDLFTDTWGTLEIYDITSEKVVFEGDADDLPNELDREVMSIDWPTGNKLTINIELEEE